MFKNVFQSFLTSLKLTYRRGGKGREGKGREGKRRDGMGTEGKVGREGQ